MEAQRERERERARTFQLALTDEDVLSARSRMAAK